MGSARRQGGGGAQAGPRRVDHRPGRHGRPPRGAHGAAPGGSV